MNQKNKLSISMGIFFSITIFLFGYIIVSEKTNEILVPKIDKKLKEYINNNYSEEKTNFNYNETTYSISEKKYFLKVYNKNNDKLFFKIMYKNNKITDTYKIDYKEGKTLLKSYEKKLSNNLNNKKYRNIKISYTKKLNKYSTLVQDKLINNEDIKSLSIYNINYEATTSEYNKEGLTKIITDFGKYVSEKNYNPKTYSFIFNNKNDISQAIKIENLTTELIVNNLDEIITKITENDKTIMNKYNIKYTFLN